MSIPPANRDFVWDQIVDVVDDYFEIDREERIRLVGDVLTTGRIDTVPLVSATELEPWRGDTVTPYDRAEATLQSMRRRAIVQVIPQSDGSYMVDVAVYKELEDVARPEFAPVGAATFRVDNSLQGYTEPTGPQRAPLGWISKGRDPALEQRILSKIKMRLVPPQPFVPPTLFPF
jgi:hypothetical protein